MSKALTSRLVLLALLAAASPSTARGQDSGPKRLPTGQRLDPAGDSVTLWKAVKGDETPMPVARHASPVHLLSIGR